MDNRFKDDYSQGVLNGLGWRVALASKSLVCGGAGFGLFWESVGLIVYVWPALRGLQWLCLRGERAGEGGGLDTLAGAPFPDEGELTSLGGGAPVRGRPATAGEFEIRDKAMLGWAPLALAEAWTNGGNCKDSTRITYLGWIGTFCRRMPQSVRLKALTAEHTDAALAVTPKSTRSVCRRFATDMLALRLELNGSA